MVAVGSDLERRRWIKDGMIQASAKSFWGAYKGQTTDSIIRVVNDRSKSEGNTVVFDMRGKIEAAPVRGTQTAEGTGVTKKLFSDKVTIDSYRWVVDNGTKFYGKAIGNTQLNEHSDSRRLLSDQWVRSSDQAYFDLGQQCAQYGFNVADAFNLDTLGKIEYALKSGEGFDVKPAGIGRRDALEPFITDKDGEPFWLVVVDTATKLRILSKTKGIGADLAAIDVRGNNNRLIRGAIGKLGSFVFVEAPLFTGITNGKIVDAGGYYLYENSKVYNQGLRTYIEESGQKYWQGTAGYNERIGSLGPTKVRKSRALILGRNCFQFAMGLDPEFHLRTYDFDKFSESCLEVWCGAKPVFRYAENDDYDSVTAAGYYPGFAFMDLTISGGN